MKPVRSLSVLDGFIRPFDGSPIPRGQCTSTSTAAPRSATLRKFMVGFEMLGIPPDLTRSLRGTPCMTSPYDET